jgi:hypothetical protein
MENGEMRTYQFLYPHPDANGWIVFIDEYHANMFTIHGSINKSVIETHRRRFTESHIKANLEGIEHAINQLERTRGTESDWINVIAKMRKDLSRFQPQEW